MSDATFDQPAATPAPSSKDTPEEQGQAALVLRFQAEDEIAQKFEHEYRKDWPLLRNYVSGKAQKDKYTVSTNIIAPNPIGRS